MVDPVIPNNHYNYDLSIKEGRYTNLVVQPYTFSVSFGPAKSESPE